MPDMSGTRTPSTQAWLLNAWHGVGTTIEANQVWGKLCESDAQLWELHCVGNLVLDYMHAVTALAASTLLYAMMTGATWLSAT